MTMIARPKARRRVLPAAISVRDWPAYWTKKPLGSCAAAICWSVASASPVVTPGRGRPERVAELSWLNCSIAGAEALVAIDTTDDKGTIAPDELRTKKAPRPSG